MQTIYAYSYSPAIATGTNSTSTVWRMAYQQPIMLYKGTANTIKIVVFNNKQRVVDLTNYDVQVQIVDSATKEHFVTRTATNNTPTSGVVSVTFTEADLRNLQNRFYHIIAKLVPIGDGSTLDEGEILYLDDNYGAFTPVTIEDAWNFTPTSISVVDGNLEINFTFIGETPDSFTGYGGDYLRVNASEDSIEFASFANLDSNVIPSINQTFNLGTSDKRWNTIYSNFVDAGNIDIYDSTIESDSNMINLRVSTQTLSITDNSTDPVHHQGDGGFIAFNDDTHTTDGPRFEVWYGMQDNARPWRDPPGQHSLDIHAAPNSYVEFASYDLNSFVGIDKYGPFIQTDWNSEITSEWRFGSNGIMYMPANSMVTSTATNIQLYMPDTAIQFIFRQPDDSYRTHSFDVSGTSMFDGNVVPAANVTYSLGSIDAQWKDLYVSNSTIYMGGIPLSIDNTGTLTVNGVPVTSSTANTVTAASQPNITSLGTLTGLTVQGISNLGSINNVQITGGNNGQFLSTNGNGTLSWADVITTVSGLVNGNSTVTLGSNGILTLPNEAEIRPNGSGIDLRAGLNGYSQLQNSTASQVIGVNDSSAYVIVGSNSWTFGTDGYLELPQVSSITTQAAVKSTGDIVINANDTGQWKFTTAGLINLPTTGTQNYSPAVGQLSDQYWVAPPGGQVNLASNDGNQYVWVDDAGSYIGTNWLVAPKQWTFGTDGSTTLPGSLTVAGNLTIQGTTTNLGTQDLVVQDSLINLHSQPNLSPLTGDDGRDIGFIFHYYKTEDAQAGLVWANDTGALEYYSNAVESGGKFDGTYGNIKAATFISNITTGTAPFIVNSTTQVANLNVATAGTAGTVTTAAQPNITSVGTLTGLTVSGTSNLGAISNVVITGGTNGQLLTTNGSGGLSWTTLTTTQTVNTITLSAGSSTDALYLTSSSSDITYVLGNNVTRNVRPPQVSTISVGKKFTVVNNCNAGLPVQLYSGSPVSTNAILYVGDSITFTCLSTANDTESSWMIEYNSKITTGYAGYVLQFSPTITTPTLSGNVTATSSINATGNVVASRLVSNVATGTAPLTVTSTTRVANLNVANAGYADSAGTATSATSATTAGTVTTAAQPNITSIGTLTALTVNGATNLGAVGNVTITGGANGQVLTTNGSGSLSWATVSSSRTTITGTSNVIANNTSDTFTITGYKGYVIYKIATDAAAWVRIYGDAASRSSDAGRDISQDPVTGVNLQAEVLTAGSETISFTPLVFAGSQETPANSNVYVRVTNLSGSTQAINITLTVTGLEI